MAYTTKYRIEFDTVKQRAVKIDIEEDGFGGSVTDLKGVSAELDYKDSDRSKVVGLRQSTLTISAFFNQDLNPEVFLTTSETQYKVKLYYNGTLNWVGWLDSSNMQIPFVDVDTFTLVANDGLHLLHEAKLQNLSDADLWGNYSIKDFICFCLDKTQLGLNFWTWIDIYPTGVSIRGTVGDTTDTFGNLDPLNQSYIYNTTFQNGIKEYDNPFIVLQKICESFRMTAFQARGEWHFVYIEDWIRNLGLTGTQWNASGVAQQFLTAQRHRVDVGLSKDSKLANGDALLSFQKLFKSVRHDYAFDVPVNLIRNLDLNETVLIFFSPASYFYGSLTHWTSTGTAPWVYVILDAQSLETERYIRVDLGASGTSRFTCTSFQVNPDDFFSFNCKYTIGSVGGSTGKLYWRIKVNGLGTDYYLKADGNWQTGGSPLTNPVSFNSSSGLTIANVAGIPSASVMEITLGFDGVAGGSTTHIISDMSFNYTANISSRFSAKGHYYSSEQTTESKLKFEEDIYIGDSLNRVICGALVNGSGVLIPTWKHNGVSETVRFGLLITRATWKLFYRNFYRIEGNLFNMFDGNYLLSPLNTIIPESIEDTEFNVATLRVDIGNEQAEGTFVELLNTSTTDDFDEVVADEKFQYINAKELEVFVEPKVIRAPPPIEYGVLGWVFWAINNRKSKRS